MSLRAELQNLRIENSILSQAKLCVMCMGPTSCKYEYAEELKELKIQLKLANQTIQKLVNRDYCQKELDKDKEAKYAIRRVERLEEPKSPPYTDKVNMVTLTFDRSYFKHLNSRSSQRDYILYALGHITFEHKIFGCFELHEDGVVHSHFMTNFINTDTLNIIKNFFTIKDNNIHAVHVCEKTYEDAYQYITKKETKDPNELQNYYYK